MRSRREPRDGPLAAFARLHPRFGTPANAVLLQTGMALLVLSLGAFDRILAFIIFSAVVFLALTVGNSVPRDHTGASLVVSRLRQSSSSPAADCSRLMLLMHNLGAALLGAAIVLCGLPVRWLLHDEAISIAATHYCHESLSVIH